MKNQGLFHLQRQCAEGLWVQASLLTYGKHPTSEQTSSMRISTHPKHIVDSAHFGTKHFMKHKPDPALAFIDGFTWGLYGPIEFAQDYSQYHFISSKRL